MIYDLVAAPFVEFGFMRRALLGCVAISLGATVVGVFLMLRRMSLTGDAMAHAILPGAAVGFMVSGLSLGAMTLGGLVAGLVVALLTGVISRNTVLCEDTSLAAFYLISLALGVLLVSTHGSNVDLMHVLFGTVLALDNQALVLLCSIATLTLLTFAVLLRALVLECADPQFLRSVSRQSAPTHYAFLVLVVLNLVGGFQALGTLMSVGIMILPAAAARFWSERITGLLGVSLLVAIGASVTGLLLSFHLSVPSGPAIILTAGVVYVLSLLFGPVGSMTSRHLFRARINHQESIRT